MIEYREGNLLKSDMEVIVHGCNCFNTFGAGIAKQIRSIYPEANETDQKTQKGDRNKLGTCTTAISNDKLIINAYTQFHYSRNTKTVDYDAIKSVMYEIDEIVPQNTTIGMPRIGCGLAGGDWNIVEKILDEAFTDRRIFIYDLYEEWVLIDNKWSL